jgi:signal transduction histidine kinase
VHAALEAVRHLAETRRVHLAVERCDDLRIQADPIRLQQVIWNLLTNAVKFTPPEGRVGVWLEHSTGGGVLLVVRDTGAGIAADFLPHLFEQFRQADSSSTRRQGGLGLGLFIVRHVVEAHGGRVWAESAGEGKGSAFFVELPPAR